MTGEVIYVAGPGQALRKHSRLSLLPWFPFFVVEPISYTCLLGE